LGKLKRKGAKTHTGSSKIASTAGFIHGQGTFIVAVSGGGPVETVKSHRSKSSSWGGESLFKIGYSTIKYTKGNKYNTEQYPNKPSEDHVPD